MEELKTGAGSSGSLVYTGRYRFGVDKSHRLSLPARWRQEGMPTEFVVMLWPIGLDRHLLALPMARWEEVLQTVGRRSLFDEKVTAGIRALGASVGHLAVDKAGRVALPEQLAKVAGLKEEAELFGLIDRWELWNPERYAAMEQQNKMLAAEFFKEIGNETWNTFRPQQPAV